jgi:DTW domain-containing protein YfiP
VDFILLLHHDEVFKPTNTGRLIADILPANTTAFEWSRTEPPADLLALLADPARYPVIVFPAEEGSDRRVHTATPDLDGRRLTLILLDGTWRQASRMFRSSAWLSGLPALTFTEPQMGRYAVRQKIREGQLATAEAAAELLRLCGEEDNGQVLEDYFVVFNEHYVSTRTGRPVAHLPEHRRLAELRRTEGG